MRGLVLAGLLGGSFVVAYWVVFTLCFFDSVLPHGGAW